MTGLARLFFIAALVFRLSVCLTGIQKRKKAVPACRTGDEAWPVHTLRVALKDEKAAVPQPAASLLRLNYAPQHLDVKPLVEAGDITTRQAIFAERWPRPGELPANS